MVTVTPAGTDETEAEAEATRKRHAMVDAWTDYGMRLSAQVEQAMRTVPRHLFLPRFSLDMAYANRPVVTHHDEQGTALSSASAPTTTAEMLDQLDIRPGQQILEIGAGTGYNAALLAHLTGPDGHVTTIDILPEAAEAASKNLVKTGYGNVQVIAADGAEGHARNAPYDRIIITAGVFDIPPAWTTQAAPGARIVLPLRVSGYSLRIALEREEHWRSRTCALDGFIPVRGAAHHPEQNIPVAAKAVLRIDGNLPVNLTALSEATRKPSVEQHTATPAPGNLTSLAIWLLPLGGTGWLIARKQGHGLAGLRGSGVCLAVLDVASGDTFAYLTRSKEKGNELAVHAYGQHASQLAARVADRVRAWAQEHQGRSTLVEVYPPGTAVPAADDILFRTAREHIQVVLRALIQNAPGPLLAFELQRGALNGNRHHEQQVSHVSGHLRHCRCRRGSSRLYVLSWPGLGHGPRRGAPVGPGSLRRAHVQGGGRLRREDHQGGEHNLVRRPVHTPHTSRKLSGGTGDFGCQESSRLRHQDRRGGWTDKNRQARMRVALAPEHQQEGLMGIRLGGVVIDGNDLDLLARFYSALLDLRVTRRVTEPKTVKNRVHLDLVAADFEQATARAAELGGTPCRMPRVVECLRLDETQTLHNSRWGPFPRGACQEISPTVR